MSDERFNKSGDSAPEEPAETMTESAAADGESKENTAQAGKAPASGGKSAKAPGFYKKRLKAAQLEKKYLKRLEQKADKDFVRSRYIEEGEIFVLRTDLSEGDAKRLKSLKKIIAQNRKGAVKLLPFVVLVVLCAAAVVFFSLFANPLLQKLTENGLEAVFEAKVNADNFRVSLRNFEIAMDGLTIADRDNPMKNLFQFSAMRIKLKPEAVLQGKVYIEEIRADHIRFGTDRTVSGAIPGRPPKEEEKPPEEKKEKESAIPPLLNLENFDAMALLNREYEKLQTPKLYDAAVNAYTSAVERWKAEETAVKARIAELRTRAEPLLKINVNDYRTLNAETIERIRNTVADVTAMVNTVQAAQDDVNRMVPAIQEEIAAARALEQNARNAFSADYNHLLSYIDLKGGAALDVLEPIVRDLLTGRAETYLAYGRRALEILEKIKALQAKLPKTEKPARTEEKFTGRDVVFPVRQYPRFFMGILAADMLTPSAWQWRFDLRGVSSDPDLAGTPTSLLLDLAETGDGLERSASFNGRADFRSAAKERFNAEISGGGFPVDLGAGLDRLGVGGFTGDAAFTLNAAGTTDGVFEAGADISLVQAKLSGVSNTFAQAAAEAVSRVNSVDLGVDYVHAASGENDFSLTTNFMDIMNDALGRIISQYRKKAEDAIEKTLREKIAQYIDGRFVSKEELDLVFAAVRGDKNAADTLRNSLNTKKTELENKIKAAAEEAARQAAEDLKEQGKQAVEDLLEGKKPSVPTLPSLPSLPSNPFRR